MLGNPGQAPLQVALSQNRRVFTLLEASINPPDQKSSNIFSSTISNFTSIFSKPDKSKLQIRTWVPIQLDNEQIVYIKIEELFHKTLLGDRLVMKKQLKSLIDRPPEDRVGPSADAGKVIEGRIELLEKNDQSVERQAEILTKFFINMLENEGTLKYDLERLHQIWNKPLTTHPDLLALKSNIPRPDWNAVENNPALIAARSDTSSTVKRSKEGLQAIENWKAADRLVRLWALDNHHMLTAADIQHINRILTTGLKNNGATPGEFRRNGVNIRPGIGAQYVLGAHVHNEMEAFIYWCQEQLKSKDVNPVELAARAAQRLVSIHPFSDRNGRTTMLVMSYFLQRCGLPPPVIENVNFAIFSMDKDAPNNLSPLIEEVVLEVKTGIERTCALLKSESPFKG